MTTPMGQPNPDEQFPVGGPRQAVYDALRAEGFTMSSWSDKQWTRPDGVTAHVYGAGSKLRLLRDGKVFIDLPIAAALEQLRAGA